MAFSIEIALIMFRVELCKTRPILLTSLLLAKKLSEACEAAAVAAALTDAAARERQRSREWEPMKIVAWR